MPRCHDLSRSFVALDQGSTLIAVIEMSRMSWLVGALVPGLERDPLKKLEPDAAGLLALLHRWRDAAEQAGGQVRRIAVAYEAGRDGFWLARWLKDQGIECYVIHASSIAVSREHRRAKTDRLDAALLKRAFLGWLRGEKDHCRMAAIPTVAEEDARCPHREREVLVAERTRLINRLKSALVRFDLSTLALGRATSPRRLEQWLSEHGHALPPHELARFRRGIARLRLIGTQIAEIEADRLARIGSQRDPMAVDGKAVERVRALASWKGLGLPTADLIDCEVLCRNLPDRRAVARYGGLTGAPDESGAKRREKGLAKAGNARVRHAMIQFAWRFLMFQKDSALAKWYRLRTEHAGKTMRKVMIVALARKLLIALWRFATTGMVPQGVVLSAPAQP